jgi:two-component system response regulator AlgR
VLRVLIVDDEPLARLRIASLVNEVVDDRGFPVASAVAMVDGAVEAEAWLKGHEADVVLLDVQMPGMDGVTLAPRLQAMPSAPVLIFVTAHAHHALCAFELDAADYLTKPVRRERLQQALERAARRCRPPRSVGLESNDTQILVVQERGRALRLPVMEIVYVRAEMKYLTVVTARRQHLLDASLAQIEHRFPDRFVRVHRSVLVARSALRVLARHSSDPAEGGSESWAVQLAPTGEWLPVSRRQLGLVREAMGDSSVPFGGLN